MDGKVAILGCARDCARYLPLSLQNAKRIGSMFSDYRIFLMESDSLDGTTDILMSERQRPSCECIHEEPPQLEYSQGVPGGLLTVGIICYKN